MQDYFSSILHFYKLGAYSHSKLAVRSENRVGVFFGLKVIMGTKDKNALNLAVQLSLPPWLHFYFKPYPSHQNTGRKLISKIKCIEY